MLIPGDHLVLNRASIHFIDLALHVIPLFISVGGFGIGGSGLPGDCLYVSVHAADISRHFLRHNLGRLLFLYIGLLPISKVGDRHRASTVICLSFYPILPIHVVLPHELFSLIWNSIDLVLCVLFLYHTEYCIRPHSPGLVACRMSPDPEEWIMSAGLVHPFSAHLFSICR